MSEIGRAGSGLETVGGALAAAAKALRSAGIAGAADEARRLVAAATGLGALVVATAPERSLGTGQQEAVADAIRRRAAREPLSRISGEREFYGRPFRLTPATLDPRPDSETVIAAALELMHAEGWQTAPLRILDVGTGSGCLLLTLLAELPAARGVATDIAEAALAAAADNAHRLGLAGRAEFKRARSLEGVTGPFDLVVSNPPYIPTATIAGLDAEVQGYDPLAALDGGPDGLTVYREIAARLPAVCPSGWTVLEVGCTQADAVAGLMAEGPWPKGGPAPARTWLDLSGHTRAVAIGSHDRRLCD